MNSKLIKSGLCLFVLTSFSALLLAGCGSSPDDGKPLSDDEKIQKLQQGRASYQSGMAGGKPAAPNK
jgi:hypothetical protein